MTASIMSVMGHPVRAEVQRSRQPVGRVTARALSAARGIRHRRFEDAVSASELRGRGRVVPDTMAIEREVEDRLLEDMPDDAETRGSGGAIPATFEDGRPPNEVGTSRARWPAAEGTFEDGLRDRWGMPDTVLRQLPDDDCRTRRHTDFGASSLGDGRAAGWESVAC
jgi:hypothetical protein